MVHRILAHHFAWLHRTPIFGRYMRALQQIQYSYQLARILVELEKTDPPNVIEFAEINAEGWAYLRRTRRIPAVVRCHTPTFVLREYYTDTEMPYDTSVSTYLEKFCINHADLLTAPSHDMANTVARHCGFSEDRINVIPNGLDVHAFASVQQRMEKIANDELIVLHVGRLDRTKGIEVLARAIPLVLKRCPNVRFVYVGADRPDGQGSTWQNRLSTYFAEMGVSNQVTFTGSIDQESLTRWYQQADITVVPSMLYESFSYTVAQAMAASLPIVAARIGGIPETIQDGGILVDPGDHSQLANAILKLISDRELRVKFGRRAFEIAKMTFDSAEVCRQTAALYSTV